MLNSAEKVGTQIGQQHVRGSVYNTYNLSTALPNSSPQTLGHSDLLQQKVDFRKICLQSLDFASSGERLSNVKSAHKATCQWLLACDEYNDWLNPDLYQNHHGFLWIKGKPGTGKSTLMKYVLTRTGEDPTYGTIISFFFNARGDELGKTTQGLYQSLLFQLSVNIPEVQKVFDNRYIPERQITPRWSIDQLQTSIESIIKLLKGRAITCIVDALDECHGDEVREMVRFFESLSETAVSYQVQLRICFSSRHYPYITIRHGLQLVLEDQPEHQTDIARYINSELQLGNTLQGEDIRAQMMTKAHGNFLWIRLVVQMMNIRWDRGRLRGLQELLNLVPSKLEQLFDGILETKSEQDDLSQQQDELDICVRWILFACRPLMLEELYLAILVGTGEYAEANRDSHDYDYATMERFVLDCSKGLVELTKAGNGTVQFIHETVREYFLAKLRTQSCSGAECSVVRSRSDEFIKSVCHSYLTSIHVYPHRHSHMANGYRTVQETYPLLDYAVEYIYSHSNAADNVDNPQRQFLQDFDFAQWLYLHRLLNDEGLNILAKNGLVRSDPSLLYILAQRGHAALVRHEIERIGRIEFDAGPHAFPLLAAYEHGHVLTLETFLSANEKPRTDDHQTISPSSQDLKASVAFFSSERHVSLLKEAQDAATQQSPLMYAAAKKCIPLVRCLLATGKISIDRKHGAVPNHTALRVAAQSGSREIVSLLIKAGASLSPGETEESSPLVAASANGFDDIVQDIISAHRDGALDNPWLDVALIRAAENGQQTVVRTLLGVGADINATHQVEGSALESAARNYHKDVVNELLSAGSDVADVNMHHDKALMAILRQDPHYFESIFDTLYGALVRRRGQITQTESLPLRVVHETVGVFDTRLVREPIRTIFIPKGYHQILVAAMKYRGDDSNRARSRKERVQDSFKRGVIACRFAMIDSLLQAGADPNAHMMISVSPGATLLASAAAFGYAEEIRLLLSSGARPDEQIDHEPTPLILAARENHEAVVRILLDEHADPNLSCPFPGTALSAAGTRGHMNIVQLLLASGADVNASAGDFGSALIAAVSKGKSAIAQVLLDHNADVHVRSVKLGTALEVAQKKQYTAIVKLLLNHGAATDG